MEWLCSGSAGEGLAWGTPSSFPGPLQGGLLRAEPLAVLPGTCILVLLGKRVCP